MSTTWVPFWLDSPTGWRSTDVTFINQASNSGTDVQTVIVTTPAATVIGDTMIAVAGYRGTALPVTLSGWTKLGEWATGTGAADARLAMYSLLLAAAPAASYTWDAGVASRWGVALLTYRNVSTVTVGTGNNGTGTTATALSMNAPAPGVLLVSSADRTDKLTDVTGMTVRVAQTASATEVDVWDLVLAAGAATGNKTHTLAASDTWATVQVSLNAAVAATGFTGWGMPL